MCVCVCLCVCACAWARARAGDAVPAGNVYLCPLETPYRWTGNTHTHRVRGAFSLGSV